MGQQKNPTACFKTFLRWAILAKHQTKPCLNVISKFQRLSYDFVSSSLCVISADTNNWIDVVGEKWGPVDFPGGQKLFKSTGP